MPVAAKTRDVSVSLLIVTESSAAIAYGLQEVFSCVGTAWEVMTGEPSQCRKMTPRIVGASIAPFRTTMGSTMAADHTFDEAHRSDVVIVIDLNLLPGTEPVGQWGEAIAWLRDQYEKGAIVCSVCTGSLMLAEAGLLEDLEATSHWSVGDLFRRCYPNVILRPERILVPSGSQHRVVTCGGSSSWAELALYLIARFSGEAEARHIAKIFLFGDRSQGQQPFAAMARPAQHEDAVIAQSQTWIAENYETANPVSRMAARSGLASRTFKRRFKSATGYAPLDYVQTLRIEEAKQMLETTDTAIDEVAASVGYEDSSSFRRLFKRTTGVSPNQYRLRFKTVALS